MSLAILLDQRIRGENVLRTIFLYPMAVSFVVTGTVWSWLLNPGIGIQKLVQRPRLDRLPLRLADRPRHGDLDHRHRRGLASRRASPWRCSWPACARSIADLIKAAQIDGAGPLRMYRRVILPELWPITITVVVIQLQFAITTFDLVRALTGGGPGIATMLPALVVYDFMFQRGLLARGAAAAVLMLLILLAVLLPYAAWRYFQRRRAAHA